MTSLLSSTLAALTKQFFFPVPNIIRKDYCERTSQGEIRRCDLIAAPALQRLFLMTARFVFKAGQQQRGRTLQPIFRKQMEDWAHNIVLINYTGYCLTPGLWTALALTDRSFQQLIIQYLASLLCFARSLPREGQKLGRAGSGTLTIGKVPMLLCTPMLSPPRVHSLQHDACSKGQSWSAAHISPPS